MFTATVSCAVATVVASVTAQLSLVVLTMVFAITMSSIGTLMDTHIVVLADARGDITIPFAASTSQHTLWGGGGGDGGRTRRRSVGAAM